mgnify:CR=1 FL=1
MPPKYANREDGQEVAEDIYYYLAPLSNKVRIMIMLILERNGGRLSFTEIHQKLVECGMVISKPQLAYHLGILNNVGLIQHRFVRRSPQYSEYKLTRVGQKILDIARKIAQIAKRNKTS